jgi:cysteinyl-tRNA synthetase
MLVDVRTELRAARQFDIADSIRDRLSDLGVTIEDSPDGTEWRLG